MIRVRASGASFAILLIIITAVNLWGSPDSDSITVYGTGYPPIKAHSEAQALLMARRAAMLDAYRNALKTVSGVGEPEEDKTFYEDFSGFMKGVRIISEEYLGDGGVRVKASISPGDVSLLRKGEYPARTVRKDLAQRHGGPEKVTVEEWYKIISGIVKFEK